MIVYKRNHLRGKDSLITFKSEIIFRTLNRGIMCRVFDENSCPGCPFYPPLRVESRQRRDVVLGDNHDAETAECLFLSLLRHN